MGKRYNAKQRAGTEFGGASQQNTTQPQEAWSTLSASDKLRLMKTTGQTDKPSAPSTQRAWNGQKS